MEAEQNGATSFDTAVKRKASYHYQGQTTLRCFTNTKRETRHYSFRYVSENSA